MIAAGVEGGSKRRIGREWSLQDYRRQRDHWERVAPPPYISLMLLASAHGAKFGQSPRSGQAIEQADPFALQALIGQPQVGTYRAPARGLHTGKGDGDG